MELKGSSIKIGISACLLGQEVRFDGGHKKDPFLTTVLAPHVVWVPVCPEVEMGLGTPRETLRLVRSGKRLRMVTTRTGIDHTDGMNVWSARRLDELAGEDLSGYVLKKDSPSCGMPVSRMEPLLSCSNACPSGRAAAARMQGAAPSRSLPSTGRLHPSPA